MPDAAEVGRTPATPGTPLKTREAFGSSSLTPRDATGVSIAGLQRTKRRAVHHVRYLKRAGAALAVEKDAASAARPSPLPHGEEPPGLGD
ncbi:MAG: hypothetical protein ACLP4V_12085 [Methylocella sp.]